MDRVKVLEGRTVRATLSPVQFTQQAALTPHCCHCLLTGPPQLLALQFILHFSQAEDTQVLILILTFPSVTGDTYYCPG
jgi:hypothetical protein